MPAKLTTTINTTTSAPPSESAIKHFTSLQQINDCDSGYDQGWNKYCHIGLAKHPDFAAACPGISGPKTEIESVNTSGTLP
jgi:hypothetical protein